MYFLCVLTEYLCVQVQTWRGKDKRHMKAIKKQRHILQERWKNLQKYSIECCVCFLKMLYIKKQRHILQESFCYKNSSYFYSKYASLYCNIFFWKNDMLLMDVWGVFFKNITSQQIVFFKNEWIKKLLNAIVFFTNKRMKIL